MSETQRIHKVVKQWLEHVEEDLRLAKHAFKLSSSRPYKLIAFHAQPECQHDDMPEIRLHYEILVRMLFSLLIDADRLNSEEWEKRQIFDLQWKRKSVSINPIALLQKLQDKRNEKSK